LKLLLPRPVKEYKGTSIFITSFVKIGLTMILKVFNILLNSFWVYYLLEHCNITFVSVTGLKQIIFVYYNCIIT